MTSYIFNTTSLQTNFFIKFYYYYIRKGGGRTGKQARQFYAEQAAIVSLPLVAPNNVNACWGHLKLNPWLITSFIDAELSWIVYIIENKKLKHGLVVIVYFYIASHKKILIRRFTIVVLPNAFRGSTEAPQLLSQNSVLPSRWARNYSCNAPPRLTPPRSE